MMEINGQEEGLIKTSSSFHRIILPSVIRECRLVLPKKFVDEHGDKLSKTIKLCVPPLGAGCWYVGLKRSAGLLYLRVGWEKFMKHYSIRFGYLLLFKYKGNSEFDVHIFDLTANEIRDPLGSGSGSDHTSDYHTSGHGKGSCSNVKLEDDEDDGAKLVNPLRRKRKVLDPALAAAEMYETENPFFIVKLKGYNMKNMVYLPRTFTREHMNNACSEFIEILDSDNKKWPVRFKRYDTDWTILSTGWTQFVKAKGLKPGDVCVFELIAVDVMKVSVFHAKPHIRSRVRALVDAPNCKCTDVKPSPALEATAEMYKAENPFFIVKLKDYNLNKNMLYLPRTFTREHMNNGCSEFIEILDSRGMKWPVRLYKIVHDRDRMMLSSGWTQVVEAEGLKTGDVCVFELMANAVMKVSVLIAC